MGTLVFRAQFAYSVRFPIALNKLGNVRGRNRTMFECMDVIGINWYLHVMTKTAEKRKEKKKKKDTLLLGLP
jgi:hypothetical protein